MFSQCCGRYLSGESLPPTAEALMRSRYTAFSTRNVDYIMATQKFSDQFSDQQSDRAGLKASPKASLKQSVNSTQWTNLMVVSTRKGKAKDRTGIVEFVAAYRVKPLLTIGAAGQIEQQIEQMHERSHFIQAKGQWLYIQGDRLPPYQPKRTDACWCGSGKKFKQCHG
ncbi:MAG: YchJ family metal-binding protein [Phormidesmis sp.]